jgi:tRNA 2-thiouridine synthesizing protein B
LDQHPVYALQADLEARGLTTLIEGIQVVDYDGFVELIEQHQMVPWL